MVLSDSTERGAGVFFSLQQQNRNNSGVDKLKAFWSTNRRTVALCLDVRYPDTSKVYHAHWRKYQHKFHSQISNNLCQPNRPGFRSVHYTNKHFPPYYTPTSTRSLPTTPATDFPSSPSVTHSFHPLSAARPCYEPVPAPTTVCLPCTRVILPE